MECSRSVATKGRALDPRKRVAILDGAREVFLRTGFSVGGMDDVALVAGVSKQTVYRHFGSKEALIVGLVEAMCADWPQSSIIDFCSPADPAKALREEGQAMVRALTTPENIALYRAVVGEAGRSPALGQLFWDAGPAVARERIAAILKSRFGRDDAAQRADVFVQIALGQAYLRLTLGLQVPAPKQTFRSQLDAAIKAAMM